MENNNAALEYARRGGQSPRGFKAPDGPDPKNPTVEQDAALMRVSQDDRLSIKEKAVTIAKSGLYKDLTTPERVIAVILMGRALGVNELTALQGIYVINGRPWVSADLFLALVRSKKVCKRIEIDTSLKGAFCKMERRDDGFTYTSRFGPEEAKLAKLDSKETYKMYPDQMYLHRAVRRCCSVVCPELLMGLGFDDEGYYAATEEEIPGLAPEEQRADAEAEIIIEHTSETVEEPLLSGDDLNSVTDLYAQIKDLGGNGDKFSIWLKDNYQAEDIEHVKQKDAPRLIKSLIYNVQKLTEAKEKREAKAEKPESHFKM